ncbi:hypothetical protein CVT25_013852 [Psilocybe cyanescens]|uniref:Transcription factor CBF/NF-Y/archaeal histone domain-containing protein n=1 Tax=Psilocybe cyanescens TaxID=93625 RepID=A0A409XFZ0_PSICY|nr:hypothetical protein CVT25_013852 [Psilocybe cyanescens]
MTTSNLNGLSLFVHSGPTQDDETDVEAELEVDQLDSDTDPDEPADTAKTHKAKNGSQRPGERIPGHTLLPAVKLENMIQADGVTGNLALSKEGLFVLSIATEEFIKRLIQAGHREASAHRRNQINYTDMAATTQQYQEFMCLADTIPSPVSLADALLLRQEKERELLEDNPALAVPFSVPSAISSPEPEISTISASKPHKKSRTTNGKDKEKEKDKTNGSTNTNSRRGSKKSSKSNNQILEPVNVDRMDIPGEANGIASQPTHNYRRSARNGLSVASSLPLPSNIDHPTGISPSHSPPYYSPTYSREESFEPTSIPSRDPESLSHSPPYDPAWPGQFTGPASGFLQGPAPSFGRVAQNPGRTIYSHNHRPD